MTTTAEGTHACDRCGADIGNGGITEAVTVSLLDNDGNIRNLRWGMAHRCGCARAVLTASTHAHYGALELYAPAEPETAPAAEETP